LSFSSHPSREKGEIKINMDRLKWILLGIFLILDGLLLIPVSLGGLPLALIAGICAVVAGILFLIDR
jgi:hypothetical protein